MTICGGWPSPGGSSPIIPVAKGYGIATIDGSSTTTLYGKIFNNFYSYRSGMTTGDYPVTDFTGPDDVANDIAFSPDGLYIAIRNSSTVKIFKTLDFTLYDTTGSSVDTAMTIFSKINFSPNSIFLAMTNSGSSSTHTTIRDVQSLTTTNLVDPDGGTSIAYAHCFSSDSSMLYVITGSKIKKIATSTWTQVSQVAVSLPTQLAISPDNRFLAVVRSASPYLKIYDAATLEELTPPAGTIPGYSTAYGSGMAWSEKNILAIAHNTTPFCTFYDTTSPTPSAWPKFTNPPTLLSSSGRGVAFSRNGGMVAMCGARTSSNPTVIIYRITHGAAGEAMWTLMPSITPQPASDNACQRVVFTPDWR